MAATQLRSLIHYHIDNELLETANFLAGRLHALEPRNPDASHLLSLTYQRQQRHKAAYDSAHKYGANGRHLGCAYVFAQACLQLGRYHDGVQALDKARELWQSRNSWNKHNDTSRRHIPDAAAVLTVLGKLSQAAGDMKRAGEYYVEVHKANPFVWEAFDGLCKIGADLNLAQMFRSPAEATKETGTIMLDASSYLLTPVDDQSYLPEANVLAPGRARSKRQGTEWELPTTPVPFNQDSMITDEEPDRRRPREGPSDASQDPLRRPTLQTLKRTISGHIPPPSMSDPPSNPRRSNRLFGQGVTAKSSRTAAEAALNIASRTERDARPARIATGAKGRAATTVGRVVSGNRKIMPPDPVEKDKLKRTTSRASDKTAAPAVSNIVLEKQSTTSATPLEIAGVEELLENFKRLAVGAYAASRFNLPESVQAYKTLPPAQRDTPWVLAQLGKAYYEMAEYSAAEDCFARLLKLQPSRVEDMEVYSTVLWHLKKDTALALLCHSLRDKHYEAPQTWVVIGNTFSLAREHDQAISAFRRATQLDKKFAYAWVLMGHEYIANEEFDLALYAFRKGVTTDRRGYGGWYGLGKALERMGKYEDAERHYRIATSINPSNATLLVCIGVVLEKLSNRKSALVQYTRALHLAPNSALARFKKARVLMHLRQFEPALVDLEILRDQAPDEANVWFLLGKCYKGLGDKGDALRAFTTALNLDAKASPFIREAMETLDDEYEDDVESD